MKCRFVLAVLAGLILGWCECAEAQDEQYLQIYSLIQQADGLHRSDQPAQALAKYLEAQTTLRKFQKVYPDWNVKVVGFRLNYLAAKIAEVSALSPPPLPAAATPGANGPATTPVPAGERADLENQLHSLQNFVRQLQADNLVLESKLKEAFSAQPASVDPRELAKAQETILSIEKENALLKVTLTQEQAKTPTAGDTNAAAQLQRQLAEANRKLAEQTEKAAALAAATTSLQSKLDSLIPASWNAANLEATRKALESANLKLAEQTELASKFAQEKDALRLRIKTLETDAETMAALHAENELLKKQLADIKPAPAAGPAEDVNRRLAEAQAQIAALQSDKEILRLQTIALQNRLTLVTTPSAASTLALAASPSADAARVKQLERERADLQKKLEATQRQLYGRKSRSATARIEDLTGQLAVLRARLGVFEVQQVPYTPEELALLKPPDSALAAADAKASQKSVRELPAGSATLVAEAQRDFAAKQFDKAEQKYLQVVHQDEKNVYTLANLATIQLQLDRLDDAEKHIRQAVSLAPDDAYSLLILGEVNIRKENYDAALDALSRAAKVDPHNAEIQNYLGITLSQKGMRAAAETAFRKAIQLEPDYASAHNNLAVFYITHKPPSPELARWHYQKALAAGFPHNPDLEKILEPAKTAEAGQ